MSLIIEKDVHIKTQLKTCTKSTSYMHGNHGNHDVILIYDVIFISRNSYTKINQDVFL